MIYSITNIINESEDIQSDMGNIGGLYESLDEIASKLNKLVQNQEFIYESLTSQLNANLQNKPHLKETYALMSDIDCMQRNLEEDCNNKIHIIRAVLPDLIFGEDNIEKLNICMDLWIYHNFIK